MIEIPKTFEEQAAQRMTLYADALHTHGVFPGAPLAFVGVLTTGLPGEVIELALITPGAEHVWRAQPLGPIEGGAYRRHGLTTLDLASEPPFTQVYPQMLEVLQSAGPVTLIAWTGRFITAAVAASLPPGTPPLTPLDLQAIVDEQDRTLNPYARYLPSLPGMGYTVETPQIDPASALSHARALQAVTAALLERRSTRIIPPRW